MPYTKDTLYTAPTIEPVSVSELRDHLRLDDHTESGMLSGFITAARTHLENIAWRAFISQTWDVYFDAFEAKMVVPRPPLSSITSITYVDTAGSTQTLSTSIYEAGIENELGHVRLQYNQTWPTTRGHSDDIRVRAVCGYGAASSSVPQPIRQAILLLAGYWYSQRETASNESLSKVPYAVESLIASYRCARFV